MQITHYSEQGYSVFRLEGIFRGLQTDSLQKYLDACLADESSKGVVLDFSGVEILDSMAIGLLTKNHTRFGKAQSHFLLCHFNPNVMKVLRLTGMDKFFRIYANVAEAIINA